MIGNIILHLRAIESITSRNTQPPHSWISARHMVAISPGKVPLSATGALIIALME